jgi:hypothetical protein
MAQLFPWADTWAILLMMLHCSSFSSQKAHSLHRCVLLPLQVREFVMHTASRWGGAHPDPKAPGPRGFKGLPLTQQMSAAAALFTRRLQVSKHILWSMPKY